MRSKDPELMERICSYVGDYYRLKYSSPTVRAIAEGLYISKSTAHSYLVEMSKRGMISYQDGVISDLPKISKTKTGYFSAPLVGSVRCGDPESEEAQVEMYVSLPEALFGRGDFYLLRAVGDSMEDVDICEGDLVLIKSRPSARSVISSLLWMRTTRIRSKSTAASIKAAIRLSSNMPMRRSIRENVF